MTLQNENKPLISVIVPVYKVEKYIEKCVKSIRQQSYQNLEIILVDDGSPDRCPRICDEFAQQDNRIVVIHKTNGGLSDARNAGIEIAQGDYLSFVDSDDYIHCQFIEVMYNNIKENDAQISICDLLQVNEDQIEEALLSTRNLSNNYRLYSSQEMVREIIIDDTIQSYVCNKLYKCELFNQIRFPVGKIFEDRFVMYKLVVLAKKIIVSNFIGYYYLQRESSICGCEYCHNKMDFLEAQKNMLDFCLEKYPQYKDDAEMAMAKAAFLVLTQYLRTDGKVKEDEEYLLFIIKKYLRYYFKSGVPRFRQKCMALVLCLSYPIYKKIYIKLKV